ncbi:hypothetical protein BYT27DRAFT_6455229 [Phlegmacium glaucopus]|nr:hypothetical protein BYT27DRAFT_6455229 [Phlegmacium glaucopus]
MLNELGMETDRKVNIVRSLKNLSHEADALVQRCVQSAEVWPLWSPIFPPYLIFHGSLFVLDVPCAPNIESFKTGRSTVNAFSGCYSTLAAVGFLDLLSGSGLCGGFCTTWGTTDESYFCLDLATDCQPRPQRYSLLRYLRNPSNHWLAFCPIKLPGLRRHPMIHVDLTSVLLSSPLTSS